MVSNRTQYSIAQLLELLRNQALKTLLNKHGITGIQVEEDLEYVKVRGFVSDMAASLRAARDSDVTSLLKEICRTPRYLRDQVENRRGFDQRFKDLEECLRLD